MSICQVHKDSLQNRKKWSSFVSRPHISVSNCEIKALDSFPVIMALPKWFIYSFFLLWAFTLISTLDIRNFEVIARASNSVPIISWGWKQNRTAAVRLGSSFLPSCTLLEQPWIGPRTNMLSPFIGPWLWVVSQQDRNPTLFQACTGLSDANSSWPILRQSWMPWNHLILSPPRWHAVLPCQPLSAQLTWFRTLWQKAMSASSLPLWKRSPWSSSDRRVLALTM